MTKIENQISELKALYKTKNIFDKTSLVELTDDELLGCIDVLKLNKSDGEYVVSDRIKLILSSGKVSLIDADVND